MIDHPCGRFNQCFKSHRRTGMSSRLRRFHSGRSFQYFPTSPWPRPQRISRGKRSRKKKPGWRGSGSKAGPVECKGHQSENLRTTHDSFVCTHERLFEIHWLGLNSPNISSSHPPLHIHTLLTSLHPPRSEKTRACEGEVAGGAPRCPAPRD